MSSQRCLMRMAFPASTLDRQSASPRLPAGAVPGPGPRPALSPAPGSRPALFRPVRRAFFVRTTNGRFFPLSPSQKNDRLWFSSQAEPGPPRTGRDTSGIRADAARRLAVPYLHGSAICSVIKCGNACLKHTTNAPGKASSCHSSRHSDRRNGCSNGPNMNLSNPGAPTSHRPPPPCPSPRARRRPPCSSAIVR